MSAPVLVPKRDRAQRDSVGGGTAGNDRASNADGGGGPAQAGQGRGTGLAAPDLQERLGGERTRGRPPGAGARKGGLGSAARLPGQRRPAGQAAPGRARLYNRP